MLHAMGGQFCRITYRYIKEYISLWLDYRRKYVIYRPGYVSYHPALDGY